MKIVVTDYAGVTHEIDAEADWPVMEALKAAGLTIKAECGGCCLCATCHVYIDEAWVPKVVAKSQDEEMTLSEAAELSDHSRLSCQIRMTPELDGLRLTLAPNF